MSKLPGESCVPLLAMCWWSTLGRYWCMGRQVYVLKKACANWLILYNTYSFWQYLMYSYSYTSQMLDPLSLYPMSCSFMCPFGPWNCISTISYSTTLVAQINWRPENLITILCTVIGASPSLLSCMVVVCYSCAQTTCLHINQIE